MCFAPSFYRCREQRMSKTIGSCCKSIYDIWIYWSVITIPVTLNLFEIKLITVYTIENKNRRNVMLDYVHTHLLNLVNNTTDLFLTKICWFYDRTRFVMSQTPFQHFHLYHIQENLINIPILTFFSKSNPNFCMTSFPKRIGKNSL